MSMELSEGYVDLTLRDKAFLATHRKIDAKLKAIHLRMKSVAAQANKMFLIGAGVVAGAHKAYTSFEKQLAMVSTMLDEQTMRKMPAYERALKDMARTYGESTKTLSKGLYDILSASVATDKAISVLDASVRAGRAGMTSTAVAADAITTIMNSYGMVAEQAGEISDLLFAIVKRGKLTFEDLASRIGRVAAVAATAGLSIEEVGAAIATMTRAGLQADIAVTSLRALLMIFLKPTSDAVKAAKDFGFELNTATLRAIGLTGVLQKLRGATAEQLAQIIPNTRGLAGMAAALQNVEGQVSDLDLMLNRAGLTQEAFDKTTSTLTFTFNKFWQSIKITAVTLGEQLRPEVEKLTEKLIALTKETEEYIVNKGKMIVKTIAWTGGILLAIIALSKLTAALLALKGITLFFLLNPIGQAIGLAAGAVYTAGKLGKAIGEWVTGLEAMERRLDKLSKATSRFNDVFEDFLAAQERANKAQKIYEKAGGRRDSLKRLKLEKEALLAVHEAEKKRFLALKERIDLAQEESLPFIFKQGEESAQKMAELKEKIDAVTRSIKKLEAAEAERLQRKIQEKEMSLIAAEFMKETEKSVERIRDLETDILETRKEDGAELARINREEEKRILELEKRAQKIKKLTEGIEPPAFLKERVKIEELFQERRKALAQEQKEEERKEAKELSEYRRALERDFLEFTKSSLHAQLYDLKNVYEDLSKKFKDDARAMEMLEVITRGKIERLTKQHDERVGFADPRSMWRQMVQSMDRTKEGDAQKQLLQRFIETSRREERAELSASRQRDRTNAHLQRISGQRLTGAVAK